MGKVKDILKTPPYAPGRYVAESLFEGVRLIGSEEVLYSETSPVAVFKVPKNTIVLGAVAEVITAFNGTTPVVELGDAGDTDRYLNLATTNITTTGFRQAFAAYQYTADTNIICTMTLSSATTGKIKFWLLVRTDSNKQR